MNLLPFTSIILIILSIVSLSFFRSHTSFTSRALVLLNLHHAELKSRKALETNAYLKKCPKKQKEEYHKGKSPNQSRPTGDFTYAAKLNLAHLSNPAIQKAALTLLTSLYADAPIKFSPEKLLQKIAREGDATNWIELVPFELKKGTKRSYPPITSYFYYNEKKPGLYFRTAAKEVISAYFGSYLSEVIFEKEKGASTLTEEELTLITRNIEGLSFKRPRPKKKTATGQSDTVTVMRSM